MSPTSPHSSDPRSLIRYACAAAAITVILLWTLYLVRGPLLLIYVSALFATGIAPLVHAIERRSWKIGRRQLPRPAAILVIYATVIGAFAGLGAAVVPPLVRQSQEFWTQLPAYMDMAQRRLTSWGLIAPGASFKELLQQAPAGSGDAVTVVIATLWGFIGGIFGLITILLLTFYLLVDAHGLSELFVRLFHRRERNRVSKISGLVAAKISAWLGGQMLLGLIIGTMSAIGFFFMGVPYFFVLAVIAGIGEMIPMVGPLLSAIPAVLVALTVSPGLALGVAGYCWALQLLENNVLVPKVMGQTVGLSAVTVIASLIIGSSLLGVVGALLAVPTAAIIQVLIEELYLAEKDPA
ncbi:MAG: AI-2E family transporter [Cyanobacteria bacterium]|nr:AI-2E family transporter [Cyanobacteriota bacterium]